MADSATILERTGPSGTKVNLVIMGDGFTADDQDDFNDLVDKKVMTDLFSRDYFLEDRQAFNVTRVNLESEDSGVTQVTHDTSGRETSRTDRRRHWTPSTPATGTDAGWNTGPTPSLAWQLP